ncbi:MAG: DUF4105 domain-containing protein [Treponema sp.]|nr:DUF4105 domain-containing protein [Treponema sp.]
MLRQIRSFVYLLVLMCVAAFGAQPVSAQSEAAGIPGEELTVKIAVLGPGDELYYWWGHIALIIEDAATGVSRFFDYGLFSFDQDNFFLNFAHGRLVYSTGVSPTALNFGSYIRTNRDVVLYTLDLSPEMRNLVRERAEWSVLPENRDYLYHHFKHNCATPIIELIDLATGGQFADRFANEAGRFTLRQHVRRQMWFSPPADWILNFWMGQNIDLPITVWEEMFLPEEVGRNIAGFEYVDRDGVSRPLVLNRENFFRSTGRVGPLDFPKSRTPRQFLVGLGIALLVALVGFGPSSRKPGPRRQVLGVLNVGFGLVFGGVALMLFFMAFFTEHDYTFGNANLLFANPLLFALFPLGLRLAISGGKRGKAGRKAEPAIGAIWFLVLLGILASMLIKLTPWFWQDNLADQLLFLPIALVSSLRFIGLMWKRFFVRHKTT